MQNQGLNCRVYIQQIFLFQNRQNIYQYQVEKRNEINQKGFMNILTKKIFIGALLLWLNLPKFFK